MEIWLLETKLRGYSTRVLPCLTLDLARKFAMSVIAANPRPWTQSDDTGSGEMLTLMMDVMALSDDGESILVRNRCSLRITKSWVISHV
jgi:hypothetical protein